MNYKTYIMRYFYNFALSPTSEQIDRINRQIDASAIIFNWARRKKMINDDMRRPTTKESLVEMLPEIYDSVDILQGVPISVGESTLEYFSRKCGVRMQRLPKKRTLREIAPCYYYAKGKLIFDRENKVIETPDIGTLKIGDYLDGTSSYCKESDLDRFDVVKCNFASIYKRDYGLFAISMNIDYGKDVGIEEPDLPHISIADLC